MFSKDDIIKLVFVRILSQNVNCEKTFTSKDVIDIISIVAIMVGDPCPSDNKELYVKLLEYLDLPRPIYEHLMTSVLASRAALKESLELASKQSSEAEDEISKFMSSIPKDDN